MEKISDKVIGRLTQYHCILAEYIKMGNDTITSSSIAQLLKIDDSQVRKDISMLNNTGKSRVGYDVLTLKETIEKTLGFEKPKNAYHFVRTVNAFSPSALCIILEVIR